MQERMSILSGDDRPVGISTDPQIEVPTGSLTSGTGTESAQAEQLRSAASTFAMMELRKSLLNGNPFEFPSIEVVLSANDLRDNE